MKILFYFIFTSCILWVLASCNKHVKIYTVNLLDNSDYPNFIHIPVTINDSIYRFMFDTGTSYNVVNSVLAQKIGLSVDSAYSAEISNIYGPVRKDSIAFAKKKYSIGELSINGLLALNGYKGLYFNDIEFLQRIGAIMGMETIHQFNWLFNFADNTVTISKDKIEIPVLQDDKILTFDYYSEPDMIAHIAIKIDGQNFQNILFDTGFDASIFFSRKKQNVDIIFSESDFAAYTNKAIPAIGMDTNNGKAVLIDSIQINNFTMHSLVAAKKPEIGAKTIITANFVRRFRMMYFDSMNKKIQLYVSTSDSARYERKDIQDLIRTTLPHVAGGDTIDVDLSRFNM